MENTERQQDPLSHISDLLESGKETAAETELNALHPAEIAHVLESLPHELRDQAWELVADDMNGDVLLEVNDEVRSRLIDTMEAEELLAATEGLQTDDLADILPDLPEKVISELLRTMEEQDRHRLESVLQYPEDTAGGLMNVDAVTVRPEVSLDVVLRYLRFRGHLPDGTDKLIVVNREDTFLGLVGLDTLLTQDVTLTVAEVIDREGKAINASASVHDVAAIFEKHDLISAPVIDDNNKLLGRITIDDVVDVIRDEADHSIMSLAGLDEEEDMFAPVFSSTRRRSVWLGVNLITALLASWVISLFDATLEQMVALAILMPIVASMGGIAGSQTLTIVIRGIALGQVGESNAKRLLRKELGVGALSGILWAVVIGVLSFLWFENSQLGLVIGIAILCNLVVAALAGAMIPIILRHFGADPALAGSVVLTTVTDVVGFFAFLGLAAAFLV